MVVVGAVLTFDNAVRYPHYLAPARALHISALADQQLAGVVMWFGGGLLGAALTLGLVDRRRCSPKSAASAAATSTCSGRRSRRTSHQSLDDGDAISSARRRRLRAQLGGPLGPVRRRVVALTAFVFGVLALTSFDASAQQAAARSDQGAPANVGDRGVGREGPRAVSLVVRILSRSGCAGDDRARSEPARRRCARCRLLSQTGRMPLASPRDEPTRTRPAFDQADIRALVAFVASFGGPAIPTVDAAAGPLAGHDLFALDCAGCHTIQARGGIVTGAVVPALTQSTPRQIAEAIRIGPYAMPRVRSGRDLRGPDRLDRPLRAEHRPPRGSRRLEHRPDRPDHRGHGRLAARDRRAAY